MIITKSLLKLIAQSLEISPTGTIKQLKTKICDELHKTKSNKKEDVLDDMKKMVDDNKSIDDIMKHINKTYNMKMKKNTIITFAEIMDAYEKKDYTYIEDNIDNWDKNGLKLVKSYAKKHNLTELMSI
jgi:hypothetical protein